MEKEWKSSTLQKKAIIAVILIGIVSLITGIYLHNKNIKQSKTIADNHDNNLAIMVETKATSGKYIKSTSEKWPSNKQGYVLNTQMSKCVKAGDLTYQKDTDNVLLNLQYGANKCELYFSKETLGERCTGQSMVDCFIKNYLIDDSIIYHNRANADELEFENSNLVANDNSYRYTGSDPFNYICLDGSVQSGACSSSDDLYRIIGLFSYNGNYYAKLIKYEYVKGNNAGSPGEGAYWNMYPYGYYFYKGDNYEETISYWWNNKTSTNSYVESNLFSESLNIYFYNYLTNKNNKLKDYIVSMPVYTNGCDISICENASTKVVYEQEKTDSSLASYYISLMYLSDYLYGASSHYWLYSDKSFYTQAVKENWLYMGLHEWVITKSNNTTDRVYIIFHDGKIDDMRVASYDGILAIRPTFYLNSKAKILSGNGTKNNPIRIG